MKSLSELKAGGGISYNTSGGANVTRPFDFVICEDQKAVWQKWVGDPDSSGGCGGAIGMAPRPCACLWREGNRGSGQGWACDFCEKHNLECPRTHFDYVTTDEARTKIQSKYDQLEAELLQQSLNASNHLPDTSSCRHVWQ